VTVEATALETPFQTRIAASGHSGRADTRRGGAGGTAGLPGHELREAAVPACLAITARMAVEQMDVTDPTLIVRVWLDRSDATTVVNYRLTPGSPPR
jgi:putative redox protein